MISKYFFPARVNQGARETVPEKERGADLALFFVRTKLPDMNWMSCIKAIAAALMMTFALSGCAEPAGSGATVTIPLVQMSCTTARCRSAVAARAYIVYTTSSCANPAFGATVAGSTTLSCNGSSCSGTVISFTNQAGSSANIMREGYYSVCVIVDFNSNYIGSAIAGEDSTGVLADTNITSGLTTKIVTVFSDI